MKYILLLAQGNIIIEKMRYSISDFLRGWLKKNRKAEKFGKFNVYFSK